MQRQRRATVAPGESLPQPPPKRHCLPAGFGGLAAAPVSQPGGGATTHRSLLGAPFYGHRMSMGRVPSDSGRSDQGPIAWCAACGSYFWKAVGGLAQPCRGEAPNAQVRRLAQGLFPSAKPRFTDWRVEAIAAPTRPQWAVLEEQLRLAEATQSQGRRPAHRVGAVVPRKQRRISPAAEGAHEGAGGPSGVKRLVRAYGFASEAELDVFAQRYCALKRKRQNPPEEDDRDYEVDEF